MVKGESNRVAEKNGAWSKGPAGVRYVKKKKKQKKKICDRHLGR